MFETQRMESIKYLSGNALKNICGVHISVDMNLRCTRRSSSLLDIVRARRFNVQTEVHSKGWDKRRVHSRTSRMLYNIAVALLLCGGEMGVGLLGSWGAGDAH